VKLLTCSGIKHCLQLALATGEGGSEKKHNMDCKLVTHHTHALTRTTYVGPEFQGPWILKPTEGVFFTVNACSLILPIHSTLREHQLCHRK